MHIPDGFLDPKTSGGLLGLAAGVLGYCLGQVMRAVTSMVPQQVLATVGKGFGNMQMAGRRMLTSLGKDKLYQMGVVAAWIFSAQMLNFPVASGTSGHLMGGVFAAVLLGPSAGAVVIAAVLLVQAIFFADGGIMALGANIVNMAVLGSFVSYYLYAGLKKFVPEILAVAVAAWLSVVMAAVACSLEISFSGTVGVREITGSMVRVHALIGIAEALITIVLLKFFRKDSQHEI